MINQSALCWSRHDAAASSVTVVATAAMVPRALSAAAQLEREGISIEVVDPRTLKPLDEDTILDSVRKTNRLVIVHEAWMRGGFGAGPRRWPLRASQLPRFSS